MLKSSRLPSTLTIDVNDKEKYHMSEQVALELKTGEGKRTWYGYVVSVGDYTGELVFIDKIHYLYLKSLQSGDDSL